MMPTIEPKTHIAVLRGFPGLFPGLSPDYPVQIFLELILPDLLLSELIFPDLILPELLLPELVLPDLLLS